MTRTKTPLLSPPPQAPGHHAQAIRGLIVMTAVVWLACGAAPRLSAAPQPQAEPARPGAASAQPAAPAEPAAVHGEPAAAPAGEAAAEHGQKAAEGHGKEAAGEHGEGEAAESPWAAIARLFNFALLAGGLLYLLRSPLMGYLDQRGITVRGELTKAAELKKEAGAQVLQIESKMKALPGEIDALKRRGAEEIAAEETRIKALAETERRRLLDQARREVETQLRIAERDLKKRAGELAVGVATERVKRTITSRDQAHLVDKYVSQVRH